MLADFPLLSVSGSVSTIPITTNVDRVHKTTTAIKSTFHLCTVPFEGPGTKGAYKTWFCIVLAPLFVCVCVGVSRNLARLSGVGGKGAVGVPLFASRQCTSNVRQCNSIIQTRAEQAMDFVGLVGPAFAAWKASKQTQISCLQFEWRKDCWLID